MFDLVAKTDVTVTGLTANLPSSATNITVEIYHRAGTHVGYETSSTGWTLAGSAVLNGSAAGPVSIPVALDVPIAAGNRHAFYVTTTNGTVYYAGGTAVGTVAAEDAALQLLEGTGNQYPFVYVLQPRTYIGTVQYTSCP